MKLKKIPIKFPIGRHFSDVQRVHYKKYAVQVLFPEKK